MPSRYVIPVIHTQATCHSHTTMACHVPSTHTHMLAIRCPQHPLQDEDKAPGGDPKDIYKTESKSQGISLPWRFTPHPPRPDQVLTFAGATLPSDDLSADTTGLHLLEGLHLEAVSLGGLQILWLWEERQRSGLGRSLGPWGRSQGPGEK